MRTRPGSLAVKAGGFADLARSRDLDGLQAFTVEVTVTPARLGVVQRLVDGQTPPIALVVEADGTPVGSVHDAQGWHEARPTGVKLAAGHAASLRFSRDAQGGLHLELDGKEIAKAGPTGALVPVGAAGITLGAAAGTHAQGFEGTIAAARIRAAAVSAAGLATAEQQRQATAASLAARWKVPVRLIGDPDLVVQRFSQVRAILHACGVDDLAALYTLRIGQRTVMSRGTIMVAPRKNAVVNVNWGALVKQISSANLTAVRQSLTAIAAAKPGATLALDAVRARELAPVDLKPAEVKPIAAVRAAEVVPVAALHLAEVVKPLPATTLTRLKAVVLKDLPVFSAAPLRLLSEVTIPVASSVIIAHRLDLTNQTLVIEPDVTTLYIIAEEIVAGPGAAISWRRPASTPPDRGADASLDGQSHSGVVTPDGSRNGVRGGDGRDGGPGLVGVAGHDAPNLEIWAKQFTGIPNIDLAGQPGGRGGRGQPGGKGGRGGDGAAGEWWWAFGIQCWKDPGNGGDGGNGGRGGAFRGDHAALQRPKGVGQREHRAKPGRTARGGHIAQRGGQLGVVRGIVAAVTGIARAPHPGGAAQGVDFEAAVVGERRKPGRARDLACLLGRVAGERVGVLVDFREVAPEPRRRFLDAEHVDVRQELAQLDELARVAGREHQRSAQATT